VFKDKLNWNGRGIRTGWSLRSLPTQTILWFYNKQNPSSSSRNKKKWSRPIKVGDPASRNTIQEQAEHN